MIPVRRYWKLLRDYLRPHRAGVAVLGLLVAGGIALQLINPQLMARIIDGAVAGAEASSLVGLALLFMLLAVAQQALALGATWVGQRIGWAATNELRADLADHCMRLDLGFHKQRTPGELIERIDGDVTALSNFFSQFVVHVVGNLVLLIGILVLLILESIWIGLVMVVFAAISMVAMLRVHHLAVPWWTGMRERSAEFFGFVGEILGGTEEVRANGAAPFFMRRLTQILRGWLPDQVRAGRGWSALWSANVFIFAFSTALIYWLGERLFGAGDLTIGSVYLVFTYVELLRLPMERIRDQMEDLQKAGAGIDPGGGAVLGFDQGDRPRDRSLAGWPSVRELRSGHIRLRRRGRRWRPRAKRCPSRSGSGSSSASWAVPAAGRRPSPGCSPGCTTRMWAVSWSAGCRCPTSPPGRASAAGGDGQPGRAALPRHAARQPHPVRRVGRRSAFARCALSGSGWATGRCRCRRVSTPCSRRVAAVCRPARLSCSPSPGPSSPIPGWSCSTRRRPGSTRPPSG